MKLHLLNRSNISGSSFSVSDHKYPYFLKVWHYHPELELILTEKSNGMRFVGDSIQKFAAGDVVLLGKNLPHMWLNNERYFKENIPDAAHAIAIHFKEDFLGDKFFSVPEFSKINELLKRSARGINFQNVDSKIAQSFRTMLTLDPFERAMALIELLNMLSKHQDYQLLSSIGYLDNFMGAQNKRLHQIYKYVFDNFKSEINASQVAEAIGMNSSAFSRFFKKTHRQSFTKYLNEIRVGYACKLLLESENKITAVAYESGFSNISNFNRQFRAVKGMSPSEYIKFHAEKVK
ncbi:AraC family transcriptional regulator [Flagellimonas sp.]|uniref:AraC family transcriptional regulator n=1 Tax=Flagellimonas sp. TaxID=2058762 RepID=UPI003B5A8780